MTSDDKTDGTAALVAFFFLVAILALAVAGWCDYHYDPANVR